MTTLPGSQRITDLTGTNKAIIDNGGAEVAHARITVGSFICNGASAVTVADANVDAGSLIFVALETAGGTVGAIPAVKTITPGTGFTVAGTASDTSSYRYLILV